MVCRFQTFFYSVVNPSGAKNHFIRNNYWQSELRANYDKLFISGFVVLVPFKRAKMIIFNQNIS